MLLLAVNRAGLLSNVRTCGWASCESSRPYFRCVIFVKPIERSNNYNWAGNVVASFRSYGRDRAPTGNLVAPVQSHPQLDVVAY